MINQLQSTRTVPEYVPGCSRNLADTSRALMKVLGGAAEKAHNLANDNIADLKSHDTAVLKYRVTLKELSHVV